MGFEFAEKQITDVALCYLDSNTSGYALTFSQTISPFTPIENGMTSFG